MPIRNAISHSFDRELGNRCTALWKSAAHSTSVDRLAEVEHDAVAHGFNHAPIELFDGGGNQVIEHGLDPLVRTEFVFGHHARVSDNVGDKYSGLPARDHS